LGKLFENKRPTQHGLAIFVFAFCVLCFAIALTLLPAIFHRGTLKIDVLLTALAILSPCIYGVYRYAASRDFDSAFNWFG
jgi:hypothetical protein